MVTATKSVISYDRFVKTYLKDFDWKVQILIGSDKNCSMRESHLVLSLTLHTQDNTTEEVMVELSKEELDQFIEKLERAQKTVNMLRA